MVCKGIPFSLFQFKLLERRLKCTKELTVSLESSKSKWNIECLLIMKGLNKAVFSCECKPTSYGHVETPATVAARKESMTKKKG